MVVAGRELWKEFLQVDILNDQFVIKRFSTYLSFISTFTLKKLFVRFKMIIKNNTTVFLSLNIIN